TRTVPPDAAHNRRALARPMPQAFPGAATRGEKSDSGSPAGSRPGFSTRTSRPPSARSRATETAPAGDASTALVRTAHRASARPPVGPADAPRLALRLALAGAGPGHRGADEGVERDRLLGRRLEEQQLAAAVEEVEGPGDFRARDRQRFGRVGSAPEAAVRRL